MASVTLWDNVRQYFVVRLGNHGLTSQTNYTIPAGRRAILTHYYATIGELAGSAIESINAELQINGLRFDIIFNTGVAGDKHFIVSSEIDLAAGDVVSITTFNNSGIATLFAGGFIIKLFK